MPAQQLVEQLPATSKAVCVTGAGGYIASWLVKRLLEKGYTVKGTVRDPENPKNEHLKQLEGAKERLVLCRADVLDYDSLLAAMEGCDGLFHTAAPVGADDPKMVEPAVEGTRYAMRAAYAAGIRRVVYTSSIGTVYMNPHRADPDAPISDADWSDLDFCRSGGYWYCYGKTLAERAAWQYAEEFGIRLSVVNPVLVLGPLLQSTVNASVAHVAKYLTGAVKTYANAVQAYVHVRDVVEAHVKVFESEKATGGRYICAESSLHRGDVVEILGQLFPEYTVPTRCSDEVNPRKKPHRFDNQKLKDLGLTFTPVKKALYETVKSLQEKGHLPVVASADNCA